MRAEDVAELIRARDERGAEALMRRYSPLLRYVISPILPEPEREDCLAECCLRVWERIGTFDPARGSFTGWLTAIARNTALSRAWRATAWEPLDEAAELPDPGPTPEDALLMKERREALARAVDGLSEGERRLFYRKYYYMQPSAQIAAETGLSERAVEGRLRRLRMKLRRALGGECDE